MRARSHLAVPALALVVACSGSSPSRAPAPASGPQARAFDASATANGVPRDLLVAIAQTEGALDLPATRVVDPDAAVPAAGPLQLRRGKLDTLARGAARMHTSELALREDADLALEAGARVLAEIGAQTGARAGDLASWSRAVEEMGGYADDLHRAAYAHRVFALLARGGSFTGRDGEALTIAPHDLPLASWMEIDTRVHALAGAEYPGAEWFPTSCTNKCDFGRSGAQIELVVIHDTEGGWDASVATLQNDSGKSVQYIVNTDGTVGQFVHEADTAWHAGNHYYNQRSVGIEHVGYATKPYPTAQYESSAKLVGYLAEKYGITKDRAHVVGHDQVPNGTMIAESAAACADSPKTCEAGLEWGGANNHRDPGVWEWCTYMPRFGGACKCDDVTAILNCSADKTEAYRCKDGSVEVYACAGGCTVQPNGVDDVCTDATPIGADAGSPPPVDDAGAAPPPPPADPPDGAPPVADAPTPPPPSDAPPETPTETPTETRGCASSGTGAPENPVAPVGFALALAAALARTRRKSSLR